jgi:large subunit ribosomal protein LP1
LLTRIK